MSAASSSKSNENGDNGDSESSDNGASHVRSQFSKIFSLLRGARSLKSSDDDDDEDTEQRAPTLRRSKRQRRSQRLVNYNYNENDTKKEKDKDGSDDDEFVSADEEEPDDDNDGDDNDNDNDNNNDNNNDNDNDRFGDGDGDSDHEKDDDNDDHPTRKRKRSPKPKNKDSPSAPSEPNPTTLVCPHCDKAFKTKRGLQNHIDKRVCRGCDGDGGNDNNDDENENHASPKPKAARKSSVSSRRKSKSPKFRGTIEERTCPHCKRLFSSALGARYHIEQKVCRKAPIVMTADQKVRPFPTLEPGQKFVTRFGVVEVVRDDRATPTAILPDDAQDQHRKFKKSEAHRNIKEVGAYVRRSSKLRIRRNAINAVYEKGNANRRSVFEAYFDGDPEHMKSVISANKALAKEGATATTPSTDDPDAERDPKEPRDAFPDRIVECVLVPDERSHVLDLGKDSLVRYAQQPLSKPTKLFFQRRLLTERYDSADRVYYCPDCGRRFNSSHARKSHCGQQKCLQEASNKKEKREAIEARIEREMNDILRFPERRKFIKKRKSDSTTNVDENGKKKRWKKKKKRESSVYPEILIGMGFKLVAKQKIGVPYRIKKEPDSAPVASLLRGDTHEMDHILHNLKGAFKLQKRKADDQKHGSMYAEVYKKLGFKFPGKRKGTNVGNNIGPKKRRKRAVKPKPPPPPKPLPPAIDVGALVDEIKSGRYPSIKVFDGEHEDYCILCKSGGSLFCCEFCNKVEHFKCIRTKYTIKRPEPDEDFMCHKCIGIILSRRARAEKRRLLKQGKNNEKQKKEEEEKARIVQSPTEGKEYPYMAAQAQEVNELVELLKDSQIRLRRSIETTKMNNIRRQVISGVYPDGYSPPYWN